MGPSNEPSHPELLQALTAALVEHQFDLKWYIREIVNSRTYQLSSEGGSGEPLPQWFEHARVRPLTAEELTDAWRVATGFLAAEQQSSKTPSDDRWRPLGGGYVLQFFGRPVNGTGDYQGGLHEHLYLNNGPMGSLISNGKGGLLDTLATSDGPWEERVDRMYLSLLNRPPTDAERAKFVEYLGRDGQPQERLRDAIWALITCSEFRFNH